jgi:uncharacterized protein YgbK (DUF1537 family)
MKGRHRTGHVTISTREVADVIVDLLEKKIDRKVAYEKMKQMDQQIDKEIDLLCDASKDGENAIVVSAPKEWCIHNAAKAETRQAIIECLLEHLDKTIERY